MKNPAMMDALYGHATKYVSELDYPGYLVAAKDSLIRKLNASTMNNAKGYISAEAVGVTGNEKTLTRSQAKALEYVKNRQRAEVAEHETKKAKDALEHHRDLMRRALAGDKAARRELKTLLGDQ